MSEEIKDIILDVKDSLNETPKKMYKYTEITFNLNELSEILNYIEQLENENFNIRENIHLERISLPPELTKDKNFMELYDIPSYKDLQQKVEQLENIRKEAIEYVLKNKLYRFKYDDEELFEITTDKKAKDDLLNILNKGDNNGRK